MTPAQVAEALDADLVDGLSPSEVARRIEVKGPNKLDEPEPPSALHRFLAQFRNVLVYVLFGAAAVSAAVGDLKDPIVILVVLLINAVFGFVQEYRADAAMAALASMLELVVRLRRGGELLEVPASEIVPGDVVLLEAGDRIPADGRFVSANNLGVEEAALTGESVPADKHTATLDEQQAAAIGDRDNCGFMNSTVVRGRGELVVTATGMDTEVGRLAGMLAEAPEQQTPLQRQLDVLGKRLAVIAIVAVLVVFGVAIAQGETVADALIESVALAVAAIPEGLPAVVTVTLALGVSQMASHNAIVKRLASVETLGSTTAICSDKTGTLTLNQMTATRLVRGGHMFEVTGLGYSPDGVIADAGGVPDSKVADQGLLEALEMAVLCNDAVVRPAEDGAEGVFEVVGDPTEAALVVLAQKAGVDPAELRRQRPRVGEVPFDSATKYMATLHDSSGPGSSVLVVKGAPDVVLARADRVATPLGEEPLDGAWRERLEAANSELGSTGLRVLAVARRLLPVRAAEFEANLEAEVHDLCIEALVGILDPARPEAVEAVEKCNHAGIAVRMITGDHAATAAAIAAELGISGEVITGAEIDAMDDEELAAVIEQVGVCARVSPEHKVRVVTALQANGEVAAMTGDGVNDAPALKRADIGVAMGITGTEVTKEAGDMVLADDNFATIVAAVRRGRAIYENILSFVRFQLTTNIAAIGTILFGRLLGMPTPFTAIQVLYINIIADGPPAVSLGVDPPREGLMDRPPRPPGATILSGERLARIIAGAVVMTIITLGLLNVADGEVGTDVALTMTFTTFVLLQMGNALAVRMPKGSVFSRHSLTNRFLWVSLATVVGVQVLVVEVPWLQGIFDTVGLTWAQWGICVAAAALYLVLDEVRSLTERLLARRH
ncbi:MAG: HAD-IC family P-type ATPase [Actinomycetia bacterium]|nr:HAD-IC family P-type ATPase [Actinomycetes bacterium]